MASEVSNVLAALRKEFPSFVICHWSNGMWYALNRSLRLEATNAPMLRERLLAATGQS